MDHVIPPLAGIDHIHLYVKDRSAAADWYRQVLGFEPLTEFAQWAAGGGPLTLADMSGRVHLALFESDAQPTSTLAVRASGEAFLAWLDHLREAGLEVRVADHDLAWSLYFQDPDGNTHEITSYDHEFVADRSNGS